MATRPAARTGYCIRDLLAPCRKRALLLRGVHPNLARRLRRHVPRQVPVPTVEKELLEGEDAGERAGPHSPPEIREGRNLEGTVPADDERSSRGSPAFRESAAELMQSDTCRQTDFKREYALFAPDGLKSGSMVGLPSASMNLFIEGQTMPPRERHLR